MMIAKEELLLIVYDSGRGENGPSWEPYALMPPGAYPGKLDHGWHWKMFTVGSNGHVLSKDKPAGKRKWQAMAADETDAAMARDRARGEAA